MLAPAVRLLSNFVAGSPRATNQHPTKRLIPYAPGSATALGYTASTDALTAAGGFAPSKTVFASSIAGGIIVTDPLDRHDMPVWSFYGYHASDANGKTATARIWRVHEIESQSGNARAIEYKAIYCGTLSLTCGNQAASGLDLFPGVKVVDTITITEDKTLDANMRVVGAGGDDEAELLFDGLGACRYIVHLRNESVGAATALTGVGACLRLV